MKNPDQELRKACFEKLTTGSTAVKWEVYDDVPQNAVYPYGIIGTSLDSNDRQTKNSPAVETAITFDFYDDSPTWRNINEMITDFMESIGVANKTTWVPFTLENFIHVGTHFLNAKRLFVADNIRHGVLELEFWTREIL